MQTLLGLASALAIAASPIAQAADLSFTGDVLTLQGPIVQGDSAQFSAAIAAMADAGQPIKTVSLSSPGGLVLEGLGMAAEIQAQHLDVTVPSNAMCASSCFMLFAAGEHKRIGHDARIGIHSATSTFGKGEDDGAGTMRMARFVAQLGVPVGIVGRMVVTNNINIAWLNGADLQSMGVSELSDNVAMSGAAQQPKPDLLARLMSELPTDLLPSAKPSVSKPPVPDTSEAGKFDPTDISRLLSKEAPAQRARTAPRPLPLGKSQGFFAWLNGKTVDESFKPR